MALIHEETKHKLGAQIMVSEREQGEVRDPWRFVSVEMDGFEKLTPTELRTLGKWMMQQGRRIGREYKSNGQPKAKSHNTKVSDGADRKDRS